MSDEINDLSQVLDEHLSVKDEDGHVVLQVSLIATVYFEAPHRREAREAVATCCEDYFRRWGEHLRWAMNPDTGVMERFGTGRASSPRAWLLARGEDADFSLIYHGAKNDRGASPFSVKTFGVESRPLFELGYFRMSFPLLWFAGGSSSLPEALLEVCRKLKPASGYGGIGVVESPDRSISYEYGPIVYEWARRFPGLEVDYPVSHTNWLRNGREGGRDGIKGVNWLTVVGDRYLGELGGADKVASDLAALDRGFLVHRFGAGVLIQAGPRPQLGDAQRDIWPSLYVKLAKYLKPIRVTKHNPFQRGGPNSLFDKDRSEAWLRRFDDR
jgi:hypothetical protein